MMMAEAPVKRDNLDVLPSLGLIFSPTEKQNIRLVGTRTLARPEFRELAPFTFTDFVGGVEVQGNTELQQTKIWNADLRWEWFPSSSEVIAVSAFYKFFDEPIEKVKLPRIPQLASFRNADAAQNIGAELEARKNLEFIWKKLRDLSIGVNFAYIYSRVRLRDRCVVTQMNNCLDDTLADVSTSRVRPLQDQSPYVVNAYVSYDNENIGTGARVLYNVAGRSIYEVGGLGLPDIYLEPQHNLDVVFTQRLYKGLSTEFTASNLLNAPVWWSQQGEYTEFWRQGLTFTLGISWRHERKEEDDEL
jgi:outer membrane receptor protein involved in Fe transport